jgi:hypothetical protein
MNYIYWFRFTTFTGDEGSGIGTVTIDANYANAFFALVSNTSFATVTIINEEPITPPDPTNSVTPLVNIKF